MGFFKKIFKGIGKIFKKIGKGVKKAFKGFGKFMNKIGIVGQIAMMFIPFGQIFAPMLQGLQSTFLNVLGQGLKGSYGALAKGASYMVNAAYKTGAAIYKGYKTVTGAVTSFIGETTKFLGSKIPGFKVKNAAGSFFGKGADSVLGRVGTEAVSNFNGFKEALGGIIDTNPAATGAKYIEQANLMKSNPTQTSATTNMAEAISDGLDSSRDTTNMAEAISAGFDSSLVEEKSLLSKTGNYAGQQLAQLPGTIATSLATTAATQEAFGQDPMERQPRKALDFSSSFMPDTYGLGFQSPVQMAAPSVPLLPSGNTDYQFIIAQIMNSLGTPLGNFGNPNMSLSQQPA